MTSFAFPLSIVLTFALKAVYVSCEPNSYDSTIIFYKGPTLGDFASYNLTTAQNVADNPDFDDSKTTIIFFHGWQQSPTTANSQILLNAHLNNGTFNVLALDWSQAASHIILDIVVLRVQPLAEAVALFIDKLNLQKGVPFSKIHLIGHSLGAHVAGSAGRYTVDWSGKTKYIDRITGLDPAIVGIYFLHWSNARFVDVIHTDAGGLGIYQNIGTVDFWPNNGIAPQPGCAQISTCSHYRAIVLWAESVVRANRTGNFLAVNNNNPSIVIEMGLNCPTSYVQGYYTLYTNAASWFSQS